MPQRLGDYDASQLRKQISPAQPFPMPPGPSSFPIRGGPEKSTNDLLQGLLTEITKQSVSTLPYTRSKDVTSAGQTLDWSTIGTMDRLFIRNKGPNSVFMAFDINGPAVDAFTSDLSFELQSNEAVCLSLCRFKRIGVRCSAGQQGTVNAIGFMLASGGHNQAIA